MPPTVNDMSLNRSAPPFVDEAALARLRQDLLRFAVLQLRNQEIAEGIVNLPIGMKIGRVAEGVNVTCSVDSAILPPSSAMWCGCIFAFH